jgi:uncharacterized protein with von Willebrand factor type A (vWA) domain
VDHPINTCLDIRTRLRQVRDYDGHVADRELKPEVVAPNTQDNGLDITMEELDTMIEELGATPETQSDAINSDSTMTGVSEPSSTAAAE